MPCFRSFSATLFVGLGFALSPGFSRAQPSKEAEYGKIIVSTALHTAVSELKRGGKPFSKAQARPLLDDLMRIYVEKLTHPYTFTAAQEFLPGTALPMQNLIDQFNGFVLVPEAGQSYGVEQADYIVEFGEAFVAAFKPVIETNPERIVKLNATRLMSIAAKCGAPAFGPIATASIANANTPPEVKVYAFKAAEALLSAIDITKMGNRALARDHTLPPAKLVPLVAAIQENIFDPTKVLSFPQGFDPKMPPPDLGAVVSYIRRQAVRALSQVRFAALKDPDGKPLYPAYSLARIAMSDPTLAPPPGPVEVAEAVAGLCAMQPNESLMYDAVADAVAAGVTAFAAAMSAKNSDPALKTTPWKLYAAKLRYGLGIWKKSPVEYGVPQTRQPKAALEVADLADAVLAPIERDGVAGRSGVKLAPLADYRQALRAKPDFSKALFRGVATTPMAPLDR